MTCLKLCPKTKLALSFSITPLLKKGSNLSNHVFLEHPKAQSLQCMSFQSLNNSAEFNSIVMMFSMIYDTLHAHEVGKFRANWERKTSF